MTAESRRSTAESASEADSGLISSLNSLVLRGGPASERTLLSALPRPMAKEAPQATSTPTGSTEAGSFASAVVDTRTGLVLGAEVGADPATLADFAATLPELFRTADVYERLHTGRLDAAPPAGIRDLVLVSPRRVHIAQRLPRDTELALASVASRTARLGWIVAEARAKLTRA